MKIRYGLDFDADLFKNVEAQRYFVMKLRELSEPDVEKRTTCVEVADMLMGKPWLVKPSKIVF